MKPYELPECLRVQGAPPAPAAPPPAAAPATESSSWPSSLVATAYGLLSLAGTAAGAYHGARRNHGSVWSAVMWGFLGGVAPLITVPVAAAQGFGQPREQREDAKPTPMPVTSA